MVQISVESMFFQCARAIYRAQLWERRPDGARAAVPTPGAILEALTECAIDSASYDQDLPARPKATLYR